VIATRLFAAFFAVLLSLVLAAPALAQTTVTLRDGLNSYAGTRDNDAVTVGVSSVIHDRVRRGPTFASVAPPLFTMPSMENLPCSGISLP
jgi:hypothetical protein